MKAHIAGDKYWGMWPFAWEVKRQIESLGRQN